MSFGLDVRTLRRFGTSVRASLRGVRSAPVVFAASVASMAAGLLLLGGYLLVLQNMRAVAERFGHGLRITVYMRAEVAPAELRARTERMRKLEGVAAVQYVSPDVALERLRGELGSEAGFLDGMRRNPLPASFELELEPAARSSGRVRALAARLASEPGVADVRFGERWLEGYGRALRTLEWLGVALGGFLALVLGATAAATARLAVYARSDEIEIQRLVGAGGTFVRLPFYLEGILQGGLAAGIALAALAAPFALGAAALREPLEFLTGGAPPSFLAPRAIALVILAGVGLGLGGAVVSLARLESAS